MNALRVLAADYPVIFELSLTIVGFVGLLLVTGVAYHRLGKAHGDGIMAMVRLVLTAGLLLLVWHLGGLEASGITRLGSWQVWLLALGGMLYFASAGLYAFYGKLAFSVSSIIRLPAARRAILTQIVPVLYEEILFRGVVLYVLFRTWGHTRTGTIGSVLLTAVLFAIPHLIAVFMGTSLSATLLLVVEGCIIAVWWGALVLWGGSLWPAVLLHYVVNVVIAVQDLTVPMVTPDTLAYRRILWFSIPLGALGVGLLAQV